MKRAELLDRLARLAEQRGVTFVFDRHGGRHDVFRFGESAVAVPRHREVRERTALSIIRDCQRRGEGRE
ncbi:toxin-antitoxin system, toxin component, HicA family protein [Curtobacterium flaccumfaciens pv. flaccumfaciens]|nr:toxin-antitoxin system, toxin component, HicA family protein [Curtobacterium sp. MCLR17_042]RXF83272.1 toxin-antitoxin system, toxin component, HicA family protein [Curtobacterium flaccumfaciens pv. flaccumfaciens]